MIEEKQIKALREMIDTVEPVIATLVSDEYGSLETYISNFDWCTARLCEVDYPNSPEGLKELLEADQDTGMRFFSLSQVIATIDNVLLNVQLEQERANSGKPAHVH
ncbi:MAG: hypothetical protein E6559_03225 [Pantoea sp.]|uniref:hypothetical protein n=1 Tax=Pantoea piersonii TaxID=2364647 RepID=UPI0028ACC069|nr:hypothetical protein [Pantoea piersonii]MDU6438920.1 hypothetical protein [Pantoea sp.]